MSAGAGLAFTLLAALLGGYAFWIYGRRELPIPGLGVLAALRAAALVLLLLLLWNPAVPGEPTFGGGRSWVLVDASESMSVRAGPGGDTPWDAARARAADEPGAVLATFGGAVEVREGGAGLPERPGAPGSALAPALERAAEAGARRVTVVSDLRLEDPVAVEAARARLGLEVRWVDVGADVRNAGVEALEAPASVAAGEGPTVDVVAFASGAGPGDSLRVEVLEEGRMVAARTLPAPDVGRRARLTLDLPAPSGEGRVRYEARATLAGDAYPADDAAPAYVSVAAGDGALVLVSMAPDWEPRFLLPVLAGVTGLEPRGFLRAGPDRFLPVGGEGEGGGAAVGAEAVSRAAATAELLVLHGVGGDVPGWLREVAVAAPRLVLLPSAAGATALSGLSGAPARPGEWYVSGEVPPSPLAGDLAGAPLPALPPLTGAVPVTDAGSADVVFRLQLRGSGPALPGLVLRREGERRTATALAEGFWRWAFRPGEARETYRRLWSGVAGWLLAEPASTRTGGVAPVAPVVAAGEAGAWSAGGGEGDTVRVRVSRGDSVVLDTALAAPAAGTFRTPPLPPGTYAYAAVRGADSTSGRFDVSPPAELAHPRYAPTAAEGAAAGGRDTAPVRRPVRTHPLPYLLVLALLAVEWTLRRRRGLR